MLVEALRGAPPAPVLPGRRRMPGREVPQQRPRTAVHAARRPRAVQVLAAVEVAVHPAHQPVEHVAGAMAAGVVIREREPGPLATQGQDVLQHDPPQVLTRPLSEPTQPLPEAPAIGRVVRLPDPPRDLRTHLLQMLGPVADLEPRVQETEQDHYRWEQPLPSRLRPLPA